MKLKISRDWYNKFNDTQYRLKFAAVIAAWTLISGVLVGLAAGNMTRVVIAYCAFGVAVFAAVVGLHAACTRNPSLLGPDRGNDGGTLPAYTQLTYPNLWAVSIYGTGNATTPCASYRLAVRNATWINLARELAPGTRPILPGRNPYAVPVPWHGTVEAHTAELAEANQDPRWSDPDTDVFTALFNAKHRHKTEPSPVTMQTPNPLRRIPMSTFNNHLESLLVYADPSHGLDMDQPYQRGHVWGLDRRRNLIRSFLLGIAIPSLIVNNRFEAGFKHPGWDRARCYSTAVIDGKQRITTVLMFMRGQLTVPASWWKPEMLDPEKVITTGDGPYVAWDGLTRKGQGRFQTCSIGISEATCSTLEEEELVFQLVNFGGVAQGGTDEAPAAPKGDLNLPMGNKP